MNIISLGVSKLHSRSAVTQGLRIWTTLLNKLSKQSDLEVKKNQRIGVKKVNFATNSTVWNRTVYSTLTPKYLL